MKILYLTNGNDVDYQNDCLLIGLRQVLGTNLVDYNKQHHNYISYDAKKTSSFHGKGMTVCRVLEDLPIDRTDITSKLKNKYFDYIVYGSIWRCSDHLQKISEIYPKNKIILVDGEDHNFINKEFERGVLYFKRELINEHSRLFPISFAIPDMKINFKTQKLRDFSFITPKDTKTYIYDNESEYYNDYGQSRFGVTMKKGGWDCMRHYEILANGCIPHFLNIENCPVHTMKNFPKKLCAEINSKIDILDKSELYDMYIEKFKSHLLKNNTTKCLANYFIDKIKNYD
jgi:hypothetical protein